MILSYPVPCGVTCQSGDPLQLLKLSPTRPSRTSFIVTVTSITMANPQPADTAATAGPADAPADAPADSPVLPVVPNPRGYPPFDLRLLPTYTNNQLRYYHISGAMLDVDEEDLTRQLNKRRAALKAVNWDGDTRENTPIRLHPLLYPPSPFRRP